MKSTPNGNNLGVLLELLKDVATKSQVQDFLKQAGCPHSGTWEDVLEKRIPEALEDELITEDDIINLIDTAEEHGAQHVFLYSCSKKKAASIIADKSSIKRTLASYGEAETLKRRVTINTPSALQLVSVRYEAIDAVDVLILKFLETRESKERFDVDTEDNGSVEVQRYRIEKHRTTSSVRLRSDGLIELRIGSAGKGGTNYEQELEKLFSKAEKYVSMSDFNYYSLSKFKEETGEHYADYVDRIQLKRVAVRSDQGQMLIGKSDADSEGMVEETLDPLRKFRSAGGQHEYSGVKFIFKDEEGNTTDVSANFRGQIHEFSLTKQVSGEQHEHILKLIREATRNLSKRS